MLDQKTQKLLEEDGWTINADDPYRLELTHKDSDDVATGIAAEYIVKYLKLCDLERRRWFGESFAQKKPDIPQHKKNW